ncbi:bifunctional DNA primase/polymerase [Streptomyces sp. TP-A0874]|uniref:bifunctional DNA primase/polymerase n=1 Tax=Streptomyces sp. TP-A0874 TaxID=549819 RepID=UPI00099F527D|nr:bifunctional DNA primase/polymerase [Streptomyces sp. TP-A0874]
MTNPQRPPERTDLFGLLRDPAPRSATEITAAGADWLASAALFPRSVHALWQACPSTPVTLPCGSAFDVVSVPAVFGRRMLDQLWNNGPGSGPVAAHRGRVLLFAAPGTAHRLPALLSWEEWGREVPPLLCHGRGDNVTVPAPLPAPDRGGKRPAPADAPAGASSARWLVAPDVRWPWLPGTGVLLWACVRTARAERRGDAAREATAAPCSG